MTSVIHKGDGVAPYLFNSQNDLRSGWKFAAFIIVLLPVWVATGFSATLISDAVFGPVDFLHQMALNAGISLVASAISTLFAARIIEHIPLRILGLSFHDGFARNIASGAGVAAGLIFFLILEVRALGEAQIEWTATRNTPDQLVLTLLLLIVAAAFEELVFRGYPLQILMKGIGPWPAMFTMSCVFGLLHAQNPNSSRLGVFNTIVAGMMLSLAYFKTRSLWYSYGLHLAWNVGLGMVLGFPLSGLAVASLWTTRTLGAPSLLGGEYGPEGGALGTMIFLLGAVAVWKLPAHNTGNQL